MNARKATSMAPSCVVFRAIAKQTLIAVLYCTLMIAALFVWPQRTERPHIAEDDAGWIAALYGDGEGYISPFSPVAPCLLNDVEAEHAP